MKSVEYEPFDLSDVSLVSRSVRPAGNAIRQFATQYVTDLGVADDQPGHDSEVRVVLPTRMPQGKVPALIVNGSGAYLFSGMNLCDEDIEPMLPYVERGFAIIAYETDGCQPDFERDPTSADIAQMTRRYVASKAGLINAKRAISYALEQFPEIDANQLYTIGHSSGAKQALLLSTHDDRIRGCVAFAPACQMDISSKMTVARIGGSDAGELTREVQRSMPLVHASKVSVPMLLVYSENDRITRPAEVLTYAKAVGERAIAVPVNCDGHGAVPQAGFKLSLAWLISQSKNNANQPLEANLVSSSPEDRVVDSPIKSAEPSKTQAPPQPHVPAAPQPVAEPGPLPVQQRSMRHPTFNPAGVQDNPYVN
ncbi:MAG: alpha/beta hydrolase family protein [Rubripirellula sp.]